jgi:hypothetical protein
MKKLINIKFSLLAGYTILILITVLSWTLSNTIINGIKKNAAKEASEQLATVYPTPPLPSQYPDFDTIKGDSVDSKIKNIKITDGCATGGCVNNNPASIEFDGIKKKYKTSGKFARVYLYIESMVDYKRPLTNWDDIFFTINNQGGHLIPDGNSLPVPPSNISRYLYDLRSISFYPSVMDKSRKIRMMSNIDFFYFFENESNLNTWVSVSSNRPGRILKEVSIYYECLKDSICEISEIK